MTRLTSAPRPRDSAARTIHLGVDLSDAGARPALWRDVGSQAQRLFDLPRLVDHVATASRGRLDLVTFDDRFTLRPTRRRPADSLDAAVAAARVAARSTGIGLVASIDPTGVDPAHVAKAVSTVDRTSGGRAAWQVSWPYRAGDAFDEGARDRFGATAVAAGAAARHWDATSHGRPPVVVRATCPETLDLAARLADVVRVRATRVSDAQVIRAELLDRAQAYGRDRSELRVLVEAFVVLADDPASAAARLELLEELEATRWDSGSVVHVGTGQGLAALIAEWVVFGAADGFLIRPASLGTDLTALVDRTVPLLQESGLFRTAYPGTTLRDTLGLPAASRQSQRLRAAVGL